MRSQTIAAIILLILPLARVNAAEPLKLDNEAARTSYSLGYQIGGDFKRQSVELHKEAVVQGIQDALTDTTPLMSPQEMNTTLVDLKRKVVAEHKARRLEMEAKNLALDKKYLEQNAHKKGVNTTKSGLQYKILSKGTGKSPASTNQVTVHYRGTLSNGQVFDSSHDRGKPATFQLNRVIKGWTEGLQLIKEGGKIQLVIPPNLAYDRGPLEKRTLLFDVELISVDDQNRSDNKKVNLNNAK